MAGTNYFTKYTSTVDVALTDQYGKAALIRCTAANLPTDAGYAIGCIAEATDTGAFYTNTGTTSVASFTLISSSSVTLATALTDSSTTTGTSLSATYSAITSGSGIKSINGNTTNFTGSLFYADMGTVAATAKGYTVVGNSITSGSLISATTSTAGAISNGAVSIIGSGAYTSTSNAGLLDVSATATTAGTVVHITSTAAGQSSAQLLNVTASGYTTGYTGNVVQITGCSTTGASNTLAVIGVNTSAGNTVSIVNNAITAGTSTALKVSHTTSVLGAGNSLVRVSSTSADTGTTTGVLLDLSTSAAAGSIQVLLTDSSTDTAARYGFYSSVTATQAVGAIPFLSSNVAVTGTGSKFTKHIVVTDGIKTNTIWLSRDATTPNGNLTGTAGDICLNGPSSVPFYCTGTTNWTALA